MSTSPIVMRAPARSDRCWKDLTARANTAFAAQRMQEAERLYVDALAEAEAVFERFQTGESVTGADAVRMLIVATSNLAECRLRHGQAQCAGAPLVALCERLCAALDNEHARQDVSQQCFFHLRVAMMELIDKLPRAGWAQEDVAREVEQARAVAMRFIDRNGLGF